MNNYSPSIKLWILIQHKFNSKLNSSLTLLRYIVMRTPTNEYGIIFSSTELNYFSYYLISIYPMKTMRHDAQ